MSTQSDFDAALADIAQAIDATNEACDRATVLANELRAQGIAPETPGALSQRLAAIADRARFLSAHQFPVQS